ncbi:hypothetical protein ACLQ24_26440 [Micromonospora sp. DT4]|uniref:hypothetical protein n=1 Tax=Micromonospora sp. DT4 TaxID=3393438 RepID=UPI003CF735D5
MTAEAAEAAGALQAHRPMLLGLAYRLLGRPYAEIAEILDRTPQDCRQLHHWATTRVHQEDRRFTASRSERERLLEAFLAAARNGDLATLTHLMAEDVTAWNDGGGRVRSARNPVRGADRVARYSAGIYGPRRAWTASRLELNGEPAILLTRSDGGRYTLTVAAAAGRITEVYVVGNPEKLPPPD